MKPRKKASKPVKLDDVTFKPLALTLAAHQTDNRTAARILTENGCKVSYESYRRWKLVHQDEVDEWRARILDDVGSLELMQVVTRKAEQNERWMLLRKLRADRAEKYAGLAPGSDTGVLVPEPIMVQVFEVGESEDDEDGTGTTIKPWKQKQILSKWTFDNAVYDEAIKLEREAAKLAGDYAPPAERGKKPGEDGNATETHRITYEYIREVPQDMGLR